MRHAGSIVMRTLLVTACLLQCHRASAQEAPPPIPRFVFDVHAAFFPFPSTPELAASRGLDIRQLPGTGLGGDLAAHFYPLTWKKVTFGIGGRVVRARASSSDLMVAGSGGTVTTLKGASESFTYVSPQISFNFGSGTGWSYLSAGIGRAKWTLVQDGAENLPTDDERLKTIDYGGGARWFAKPHLAFSFDVRFYAINPSTPAGALPTSPRMTMLVIGAGVSIK